MQPHYFILFKKIFKLYYIYNKWIKNKNTYATLDAAAAAAAAATAAAADDDDEPAAVLMGQQVDEVDE